MKKKWTYFVGLACFFHKLSLPGVLQVWIIWTLYRLYKNIQRKYFTLQISQYVLKLASFAENRVDEILHTQIIIFHSQHNRANLVAKKNSEVLKWRIDVTCFLANQELPFRSHNESNSSFNRGTTLNFWIYWNNMVRHNSQHETAIVFKRASKTIQNDLIKAVGQLLHSHICKQIELSELVAIMLDETSDIQMKYQLSVVFHYNLNSEIHKLLLVSLMWAPVEQQMICFNWSKHYKKNIRLHKNLWLWQTYDRTSVKTL